MFRKRLIIAALAAPALCLACISAAQASTGPIIVKNIANLNGVACPTTGTCVIVGSDQTSVNSKSVLLNTTAGTAKVWSGDLKTLSLYRVSCPTKTTCLSDGTDVLASVKVSTGVITKLPLPIPTGQLVALSAMSCNAKYCLAGGFRGAPQKATAIMLRLSTTGKILATTTGGGTGMSNVSCENTVTCLASVADGANPEHIVPVVNGTKKAGAALPKGDYVQSLHCIGTKACWATGGVISVGHTDLVWPLNPVTGKPGKVINLGAFNADDFACTSATACIFAGYATGSTSVPAVISMNMTTKVGKKTTYPKLTEPFLTIGCASASECYAMGPDSSGTVTQSEITKV